MYVKTRHIAIDARAMSHPQPGGFKTYTENIVRYLPTTDGQYIYVLYVDRPLASHVALDRDDVIVKVVGPRVPVVGASLREQGFLPYHLAHDKVDLAHFPCATAPIWPPCPFVITIHDTIELMPGPTQSQKAPVKRRLMHLYNRYTQMLAARKAAAIVTVSHHSKKDIARMLRVPEAKIFVTHEAPSNIFTRLEDTEHWNQFRAQHQVEQDFILGIGSADPRKNLGSLVRAYAQLPAHVIAQYQLVIVWTHARLLGDLLSLIENLGIANRVKFLQSVSNQELVWLYNTASLFVFPSRYEGFGLPPLEAMACGAPVIAANNSSIPEIVGDAALLVDAEDVPAMTAQITHVLTDASLRATLREKGMQRAASFSWKKCAEETLHVYQTVMDRATKYAKPVTLHPNSE